MEKKRMPLQHKIIFEKYEVIDGVRVRRGNETKDWWGPINTGVTLVWKLF